MTWYVVCDDMASDPQPEDKIWTLSLEPDKPGWCTDGGFGGYGLTKPHAEFLVWCANNAGFLFAHGLKP